MIETKQIQAMIDIGRVLEARNSKLFVSKKFKETFKNAEAEYEEAKKDLNRFGMFEDCGPSYEASYEAARGKLDASRSNLSLLISFEKHYKKLKHEFSEKHPEYLDVLNNCLEEQSEKIQKEYRSVA